MSLPDDISGAPMLDVALPHAARTYLKDEFAPMLRARPRFWSLLTMASLSNLIWMWFYRTTKGFLTGPKS